VRSRPLLAADILGMATPSMPNPAPHGQQKKIVIYTTSWCPYCIRATRLLKSKGWKFEEIDVDGDDEKRAWLRRVTGRRTVPQIFIEEESVGGYDEIAALDRRGELDRKVLGP
jgi:glutaredoxin 3